MSKTHIPFLDLKRQYKTIKREIDTAVERVIDRQFFVLGEEVERFEKEFASYLGVKYVVGVGSGTDGLILALTSLGIGRGDEVITPVNSFVATATAIVKVGATPVFVDCDPNTYQIDVRQVEKKITKKTRALLPVHLYGAPAEIEKLRKISKRGKFYLVEDACQAHGAEFGGKKLGTFGDVGVFSFYPTKNLGCYGDGGALCTNDKSVYETLLKLRNYGQSKKYYHDTIGINSRLDEIQAAILRVKLQYLDKWNRERREIAKRYLELLGGIKSQAIIAGGVSCYHLFVIEVEKRDELQKFLSANGIGTQIHYPVPIHLQKCYANLPFKKGDFPIAERVAQRVLSLPIYTELVYDEILYVSKKIRESKFV